MTFAASGTILSAWIVLPLAAATMLLIAAHLSGLQKPEIPARRRRIRTASGLLMMLVTGMLAYALCIDPFEAHPAVQPREAQNSLLLWVAIIALVGVIVVLAALDALHTIGLGVAARRRLHNAMIVKVSAEAAERHRAAEGGATGDVRQGEAPHG